MMKKLVALRRQLIAELRSQPEPASIVVLASHLHHVDRLLSLPRPEGGNYWPAIRHDPMLEDINNLIAERNI